MYVYSTYILYVPTVMRVYTDIYCDRDWSVIAILESFLSRYYVGDYGHISSCV